MSSTTHAANQHHSTAAGAARRSRRLRLRRFIRHYLEMVVAMIAGMVILGPLESLVLDATGQSVALDNPAVSAMLMATNMTVAMTAWMRIRGHARAPIVEMAAAMYLPFLILLVPLWRDGISHDTFVSGAHALMLVGMLAAMLIRRDEYTGHHGH